MNALTVTPIGLIRTNGEEAWIELQPEYRPALAALEGFSHLNVLWWFSDFDTPEARETLQTPKPYRNAPQLMGIFATRSPLRPNPLGLTTVEILDIDQKGGLIQITYIDAHDGTPLLDLKPYTPSMDRVENPQVPAWCSHWPRSFEASGDFDWSGEFIY